MMLLNQFGFQNCYVCFAFFPILPNTAVEVMLCVLEIFVNFGGIKGPVSPHNQVGLSRLTILRFPVPGVALLTLGFCFT